MDRALDPTTNGLLRNRKEVTERHREEGDKKMEERLRDAATSREHQGLPAAPRNWDRGLKELLTQMRSGMFGGVASRQLLTRAARKGQPYPHLI